ncbi:MAG: hypothetical protein V1784_04100 [bacterium]
MTKDECLSELNDCQFKLNQDPRVDKTSLEQRYKVITEKLEKETPEDAADADIVAELRVALDLLRLSPVKALKFRKLQESPDIEIQIGQHSLGVEVRRFRAKVGGRRDEQATERMLFDAVKNGRLVPYGDTQRVEQEIVEMITEKSEKCRAAKAHYPSIFLYVLSDSRHNVENDVIISAWGRALREVSPLAFSGLLFRWGQFTGLLLNGRVLPPDEITNLFSQDYPITSPFW